jgi:UDP-N-acetylmuramate--alanine ligase
MSAEIDLEKISGPIHFVGIGGIGMSAIARLLLAQNRAVSGSDQSESEITNELIALGAKIYIGHNEENVHHAGALVVSTAIAASNPELVWARSAGIPIWHRSDLLYHIGRMSKLIAVTGTHGKTTTTGMIAQLMLDCGLKPSVVVGGIFDRIGSNALAGNGQYFVLEADESDRTHANVISHIAVLTNIEADHLENYPGGVTQIREAMSSFARNAEDSVVICVDDAGCRSILRSLEAAGKRIITYGKRNSQFQPLYSYESLFGTEMLVFKEGVQLGRVTLAVPGEHNKQNALGAIATGIQLELPFPVMAEALGNFKGVDRRFQIIGEEGDVLVVDDYAHHPTEVKATLQAARQYIDQVKKRTGVARRLVAVLQPHQPGRLRDFWEDFCTSLTEADVALIADVYIARGGPIENIDSRRFAACVKHENVHYVPGSVEELSQSLMEYIQPFDLVLTIGAGDITKLGPELLTVLKKSKAHGSGT